MAFAGKVLIIVHDIPVPFDRRVWREANALRRAGWQVSIICPRGDATANYGRRFNRYDCLNGIHIYRYWAPTNAKGLFGYIVEFAYCWLRTFLLSLRIWWKHGFDVIQACNPPDTYWLLARFYKLFGKKFIFDHHDLCPELYLAKYPGKQPGPIYKLLLWLERMTFRTADVVMTTNESYRHIALIRGGCRPDRVFVVRNGPSSDRLKLMPPEPALKEGRRHLVCYLGTLCNQDGIDYLLRSLKVLVEERGYRDFLCVIIGGGPELESLQALNRRLGLQDYVRFTGRLSDHDVCRYLSSCDVCVDPLPRNSFSDKSTMNKIGEYMAFGKPVVAFELTETRRTAQQAAVYARPNDERDFADQLFALLHDAPRRRRLGHIARERVKTQLAWDHSIPHLLQAYQTVRQDGCQSPVESVPAPLHTAKSA